VLVTGLEAEGLNVVVGALNVFVKTLGNFRCHVLSSLGAEKVRHRLRMLAHTTSDVPFSTKCEGSSRVVQEIFFKLSRLS